MTKPQIPLNELACYLPYGLEVDKQDVLYSINLDGMCESKFRGHLINYTHISEIRPLVLDLSDLTKEIEHGGERFVPMMELMKLAFYRKWDDRAHYYHSQLEIWIDGNAVKFSDRGKEFMFYFQDNVFTCRNELQRPVEMVNILDCYNKLFEWHFDVFGWLSKGLAERKGE